MTVRAGGLTRSSRLSSKGGGGGGESVSTRLAGLRGVDAVRAVPGGSSRGEGSSPAACGFSRSRSVAGVGVLAQGIDY